MQDFLNWLGPVWRPHPGQERFLLARAKTKVLACGRRWGKTDACAVQVIAGLGADRPRRTLLVAPTLEQASFLFRRLRGLVEQLVSRGLWELRFPLMPKFRDSKMELTMGDHSVVARSAHSRHHLRGDEASEIIVDEAAYVSGSVVNEVLTPMMATTDGSLTMISTPNGQDHFYEAFREGLENSDEFWSLQAPSSDNPQVRQAFLDRQKKLLSPSAFATEYEAQFVQREGYVFDRTAVDECVVAEPDFDIPGPTIIAVDWARYEDFSALVVVRGFQSRASVLEVDRKHREDWFKQIGWVTDVLARYPNARLICDTTGGGDSITAWLRNELRGVSIKSFVFTTESKPKLVDGLVRAFETRSIQLPPHEALKKELDNFQATRSASGHVQMAAKSGHDDLVMALAMAVSDLPYAHRMILTTNPRR